MAERDSKRIIRQWDREIEDELRRETTRDADRRPWTAVSWAAVWLLWIVALLALVGRINTLR